MSKSKSYVGEEIEITFDIGRCIHSRNCILRLSEVFDTDRKPWIDPDGAQAEEIAAIIRTCPSGALTYRRLDGGLDETPPEVNRVAVLENGPLAFHGALSVAGTEEMRATLCRCGLSNAKPYCDCSHVDAGFEATGEPSPEAGDVEIEPGAAIEVNWFENGPFQVSGPLEITTGTGHRIGRSRKAFLCRCGQSGNKPYCDGSHKAAGFAAPASNQGTGTG